MMPTATETPLPDKVEQWRKEEFEDMSFTSHEAGQLAVTRNTKNGGYLFDIHRIRKMLKAGCSHKQIFRIFL